ncbi:SDR family oxidoreductase [Methylocapsa polymorpha]|uniref:SDR family oxidoreductase n=1 Tax=Methylocapsa polymorpha TaxID=3080828 RepID=A0ABZ0HV75_9HYPH|nr:SDR family oxidoreductase [Methylocapsa sp. RX1]
MSNALQGKTCLITGATFGIGRETALGLARQGARVVIVGRDAGRTAETARWLRQEAGNDQIDFLLADLSSQAEVRRLADEFRRTQDRLDILINNAGAIFTKRETTVDGFERTWALNHLAYVLLTLELLDSLKASAPARVINVASKAHVGVALDFDDLQSARNYSGFKTYGRSKLANILFTYALARRLENAGVSANCLHPGVVATGIARDMNGLFKLVFAAVTPWLTTPEQGAATSIFLAASAEAAGVNGKYFDKCKPARSSDASYDEAVQERLWDVSLQQTGMTWPPSPGVSAAGAGR